MKILTILLAMLMAPFCFSQVNTTFSGAGAQGINSAEIAQLLSNSDPTVRHKKRVDDFVGSPYTHDEFKPTKLYYRTDLQGDVFYRYNAFNEEIEIKELLSPDAPVKGLLTDKSIRIMVDNMRYPLSFHTFVDKNENTLNGYLILLHEGEAFNLYKRINVKYSEGTPAQNSFIKATPNRFSHFTEYYISEKGKNLIQELEPKNRKFLKILKGEKRETMKDYLKDEDINLKEEQDLIKAIKFLNTI